MLLGNQRPFFAGIPVCGVQGHRGSPLGLSDIWAGSLEAPMRSRGIFVRNSSEEIREHTDGTSNKLLVGERGFASGAGSGVGVSDNAHPDDAVTDASHLSRPNAGGASYSSRDTVGVHLLICDGSVRFVTDKIDSKPASEMGTFQKLACKNDGQAVNDF